MTATTAPGAATKVGRESLWVAAGTGASRLTGFLRVFVLAYAVGQSELADLYTKANAAPNLVFELVVGGVLSATLVPLFVHAREDRDDEASSVLLSVGFVVSVGLALVAIAVTAAVDAVLTARYGGTGGDPEARRTARVVCDLLYLLLPQIPFYGISSLCTAFLNAGRRFRAAAFAPVLTNVVSIAAFAVVGSQLQGERQVLDVSQRDVGVLMWLGLGTTAGIVAMTVPVMWAVRTGDASIRFAPRFRHPVVRKVTRLSGWTLGYVIANQVALAAVIVALPDNKRYSDAFIFFQLPHGLIAVSIMTTMTPELASAAARLDIGALADRFVRGLRLLVALIVPAAIGYVLLATPITSFLQRGNLTALDARLTARAVVAFAVGLPAFSIYLFACRAFYALSDTRTPFFLNVLENGVNVVGIGVLVVANATSATTFAAVYSIAYIVGAVAALARLDARLRELDGSLQRPDLAPLGRMLAAAGAMAVAVWLVRLGLGDDSGPGAVAAVVASAVVGGATYLAAGVVLGVEEMTSLVDGVRRRLLRGRP